MLAFTASRRVVRLRNALQNLRLIDMNDILMQWLGEEERVIIEAATKIENQHRGYYEYSKQISSAGDHIPARYSGTDIG